MTHVFRGTSAPRRAMAALLLFGVALLVLAAPKPASAAKEIGISLMTQNVYVGADFNGALEAEDIPELEAVAGQAYGELLATNPNARMKAHAKEIAKRRPDVVGLQEMAKLFTGPQDEAAVAVDKQVDLLALLRKHLRKQGAAYKVAAKQRNFDIEVPIDTGMDLRLVDYDVLLVRKAKKIKTQKTGSDNFDTTLTTSIPVDGSRGTTTVRRGYVWANLRVAGERVRVVTTHLEAASAAIRDPQAAELAAAGGPLDTNRRLALVGDLNSDPNGSSPDAYNTVRGFGLRDRGVDKPTCCRDADLLGGSHSDRVDHVLTDRSLKLIRARRTGTTKSVGSGTATAAVGSFFSSDHSGVLSTFGPL